MSYKQPHQRQVTMSHPLPTPLYPCHIASCREHQTFPAHMLSWSTRLAGWVCEYCWPDVTADEEGIPERKSITLAEFTAARHLIEEERARQERLWGQQNHSPQLYLLILLEEIGEYAEETLLPAPNRNLLTECVQIAAVAQAMVEAALRNNWPETTYPRHIINEAITKQARDLGYSATGMLNLTLTSADEVE